MKHWILGCAAAMCVFAQAPEGYLDIDMAKVKMGKRMDFDELNKKMKALNGAKGDRWTAYEAVYGESAAVYFVGARASFADAWNGMNTFEGAITRGLGEAGMRTIFSQWDSLVEYEHQTLYRRRWDLSSNAPASAAELNQRLGESHWLYVQTVRTRPGKLLVYEEQLKLLKQAREREGASVGFSVNQAVAGASPGTFRITAMLKTLGDMDSLKTARQVLGDAFPAYLKAVEESVESTEIEIGRHIPELSNPPEDAVAADPGFWRPKAAVTAKTKTGTK